jgi:hypothetical protein
VEIEVRPEPSEAERAAIVAALELEAAEEEEQPPPSEISTNPA